MRQARQKQEIVFYGAGYPDTAKMVEKLARAGMPMDVHGYLDDTKHGAILGYPILGGRGMLQSLDLKRFHFVNNVFGSTNDRIRITGLLKEYGCTLVSLVDPDVDMAHVACGVGVVISAGVQMGARIQIGDGCAVRMRSVINHDNVLEDHVFIGPGVTLCGHVQICTGAFVGAGSVVLPHVTIGAFAVIGAGAVVTTDVEPGATVAGVPARKMQNKNSSDDS